MDTHRSILRSARRFLGGTVLSRISGLGRDMTMAFCFGSAPEVAAFMVAYRLANLFRRLLGEGNLQSGFVPQFEELRNKNPKEAFLFYRDSAFSLLALLIGIVLVFEAILGFVALQLTDGWREIAILTMWMAPGLIFICLSALNGALLQCQEEYFIPASAPVLFNIVWILAAFFAYKYSPGEAVRSLSIGVTLAFVGQWLITAFRARQETREHIAWKEWLAPRLFSAEWHRLVRPMVLGISGVSAVQLNSALDALFARFADLSGPAFLWYAIRIQQLPLAFFGIAFAGALLPPLSRAIREGAIERYSTLLASSLRQSAALLVPCTFGLFVLGASGLNLLYGRGDFSSADLRETLLCLWGYGLGLIPAVFVLLFATGFYSKKSYGLPVIASLSSVGINIILNALLVFGLHWGAVSIAIATSVSAYVNCWLLAKGQETGRTLRLFLGKLVLVGIAASVASLIVGYFLGDGTVAICRGDAFVFTQSGAQKILQFGGIGVAFAGAFLLGAQLCGIKECLALLRLGRVRDELAD
ncbi:MAG: murein biosynthesis integral membrane protein MurJ [Chlamydiia bacterium]|nr:murein biosynthesis integral membrane protein MurJ [Chlamydiia bacterium]